MRYGKPFGGDTCFLLVPLRSLTDRVGEGCVTTTGHLSTPPLDPGTDPGPGRTPMQEEACAGSEGSFQDLCTQCWCLGVPCPEGQQSHCDG